MDAKCELRVSDCYREGSSDCLNCKHNEFSQAKEPKEDYYLSILDKVNELFKYLTDEKIPDGVLVASRPKLSPNKAWNLIWFLQEVTHCLPDHIERCDVCGDLFDSDREGFSLNGDYNLNNKPLPKKYWGLYCDNCVPNVDFKMR